MSVFRALILGIVQGLTEFLPVSSSGHLQLVPWLADWQLFEDDPELANAFDVALHVGTLVGALSYFAIDVVRYLRAGLGSVLPSGRRDGLSNDSRIAWLLIVATIPAGISGVAFESVLASDDHIWVTAVALIVFGIVLALADRLRGERDADDFTLADALLMGLGQALALQPGVSRSGVTMTVARLRSFDRVAAARLSFLMSLPIIAGAGVYKFLDIGGVSGVPSGARAAFVVGMVAAAATGWFAVWGFLRLVARTNFDAFAAYRVVLGLTVLSVLWVR